MWWWIFHWGADVKKLSYTNNNYHSSLSWIELNWIEMRVDQYKSINIILEEHKMKTTCDIIEQLRLSSTELNCNLEQSYQCCWCFPPPTNHHSPIIFIFVNPSLSIFLKYTTKSIMLVMPSLVLKSDHAGQCKQCAWSISCFSVQYVQIRPSSPLCLYKYL